MDNYECGGFFFSANFDSGNLAQVELASTSQGLLSPANSSAVRAEFNLWTRPDCAGTTFETTNRSWFFFSISGGESYEVCRLNIVNLNKQSKLYGSGMQPVVRIGENGKWDRIKYKPAYVTEDDNFTISYHHKVPYDNSIKVYYAFTYPYTYTDLMNQLSSYDNKFKMKMIDLKFMFRKINEKNAEGHSHRNNPTNNSETTVAQPPLFLPLPSRQLEELLGREIDDEEGDLIYSDDEEMQSISMAELKNEIYYHREMLIHSVEGRRVDLLTITSFHGIREEREERIPNLFPETSTPRSHLFNGKKIIFVSSRVHPGETPATFILNGFLNILLDTRSMVAATLRKMYVFKIVPFLNPDGVYNGHYRADNFGQNLNRMYTAPDYETQPSIYAVRRIIRYYHFGQDLPEKYEPHSLKKADSPELSDDSVSSSGCNSSSPTKDYKNSTNNDIKETITMGNVTQVSNSGRRRVPVLCCYRSVDQAISTDSVEAPNIYQEAINEPKPTIFRNELIPELIPIATNPECGERLNMLPPNNRPRTFERRPSPVPLITTADKNANENRRNLSVSKSAKKDDSRSLSKVFVQHRYARKKPFNNAPIDISAEYLEKFEDTKMAEQSNVFLYIDMHGHASKKGVFMYGNHFENVAEAVECMLLPRLMSMNSHHFHFDACVFSERNMYHKGKRDGLSKEGSGRVAVLKSLGLIKSYTMEGNYNIGKYVNVLPPKGKDGGTNKRVPHNPPKYTPAIFEEVGSSIGPSILDLTNSNPSTRIHNSEFRSMQGLRAALRVGIERGFMRANSISPPTPQKASISIVKMRRDKAKLISQPVLAKARTTTGSKGSGASTSLVTTSTRPPKLIRKSVSFKMPSNFLKKPATTKKTQLPIPKKNSIKTQGTTSGKLLKTSTPLATAAGKKQSYLPVKRPKVNPILKKLQNEISASDSYNELNESMDSSEEQLNILRDDGLTTEMYLNNALRTDPRLSSSMTCTSSSQTESTADTSISSLTLSKSMNFNMKMTIPHKSNLYRYKTRNNLQRHSQSLSRENLKSILKKKRTELSLKRKNKRTKIHL